MTSEQKKAYRREWYQKNKASVLAKQHAYYLENKERLLARGNAWRKRNWNHWYSKEKLRVAINKDAVRANAARWRELHREKKMAMSRIESREYRRLHPQRRAAQQRARAFIQQQAMPKWVKRNELLKFYVTAREKTIATGIPHEVDHIWPLKGEGFVGLHVPWNLRVITAFANISKKNRRPDVTGVI
jgi:hypothetical protein